MLLSPGFSDQIYAFGGGKNNINCLLGEFHWTETPLFLPPHPPYHLSFFYRQSGSTDSMKTQRKKYCTFSAVSFPVKSERSYQEHSVQLASPPSASPWQGSTWLGISGLRTRWTVSPPSSFLGQVPMQSTPGSTVILKLQQTQCQNRSNLTGSSLPNKDALSLGELDSSLGRSERLRTERSFPAKTPMALTVSVRCGANRWSHLTRYGLVV